MSGRRTRTATIAAAAAAITCTAVLVMDEAMARYRAPREEALIAKLQEQVRVDASLAPKLEAEHKRITGFRLARKTRIRWASWALLAAAAVFLTGAKRMAASRPAPPRPPASLRSAHASAATVRPPAPASAAPPAIDLSFVDEMVAREGRSQEAAIPILQAIQSHYRYLPDEALRRLCELTEITPAQVAGTSAFYSRFRRSPVGRHVVRVCHGTACHVSGARQITEELRRSLAIPAGEDTDPSRMFTVEEVACLGCCSLAPVLMVDEHTAGKLTPATARGALDAAAPGEPA